MFVVYDTENGRIIGLASASPHAAAEVLPGQAGLSSMETSEMPDPLTQYVVIENGQPSLASRPNLPVSAQVMLSVGQDWDIPGIPVGTVVEIDGTKAGTIDETGLVLRFDAQGVWPVIFRPPFPYLPSQCEVHIQ